MLESPVCRPRASTLPNSSAIDSPHAMVDSGRKWPPRRSVSRPIASAAMPVSSRANSSPSHGDRPCAVESHALRVGCDADERRLAERRGAAHAGEQHEAERDQRADADVVQQRDAEVAQHGRRERDRGGGDERDPCTAVQLHASISSSSSSACALSSERSMSTGISRLNTITSFSAPLQNDAKLSATPTASAPIAVSG